MSNPKAPYKRRGSDHRGIQHMQGIIGQIAAGLVAPDGDHTS
ncbi:hypothetical protein [Acanthopleuribacter pedis]|nr:hypothetical protein [Acanthopleuribacter pedis]